MKELSQYHAGWVLRRDGKFRERICFPRRLQRCHLCTRDLTNEKCVRGEKNSSALYYTCFRCYKTSNEEMEEL